MHMPKPTGSLRPVGAPDLPDSLKYSKWDHIEVSDDEGDSHPNIDQKLMARLKKEKRMRDYEEFRWEFLSSWRMFYRFYTEFQFFYPAKHIQMLLILSAPKSSRAIKTGESAHDIPNAGLALMTWSIFSGA